MTDTRIVIRYTLNIFFSIQPTAKFTWLFTGCRARVSDNMFKKVIYWAAPSIDFDTGLSFKKTNE